MRSRQRLIEILSTCNPQHVGGETCNETAKALAGERRIEPGTIRLMMTNPDMSSHFRELLDEALHYLEKDVKR